MEMDQISSSHFAFFMTQDIIVIVLTYLAHILEGLSLGQAVLGLLLKLQQTICRRHPRKCSLCEALLCVCYSLDSYLNPLSLLRGQVDRSFGKINLHIQEMTARSARKDLELEALISTIATLNNRVVELEGGDTTPQAVYYNPTQTPAMVTFSTHQTSRDPEGTDVLELVPLLPNTDQQE